MSQPIREHIRGVYEGQRVTWTLSRVDRFGRKTPTKTLRLPADQPCPWLAGNRADTLTIRSAAQASGEVKHDAVGQNERSVSTRCADETVSQDGEKAR